MCSSTWPGTLAPDLSDLSAVSKCCSAETWVRGGGSRTRKQIVPNRSEAEASVPNRTDDFPAALHALALRALFQDSKAERLEFHGEGRYHSPL